MLKTEFLGFTLKNPLALTEGPLSGNGRLLSAADAASLGLIFTKGIRPEPILSPVPYMSIHGGTLMNADWSCIGYKAWVETFRSLEMETPLVASIAKNYVTPEQAVQMAEGLEKAGAKIISFVDYDPEQLVATVRLARPRLKVPLMVKLPPFLPRLERHLADLERAGIDAIAAMDSIGPGLAIDLDTGMPSLGSEDGSGYVSGKSILPFTLKYIYEISRAVKVPVVGVGGVGDAKDALRMIMAGATVVGMATAPLIGGLKRFDDVARGMAEFLENRRIENIKEIRGLAAAAGAARKASNALKAQISPSLCDNCGACAKVCYSKAITAGPRFHLVDRNICVGCGLCFGVCPRKAIGFA
jgi:dihydroorotate dehydrogenase (fumarate)